jgi:hypothetical protein
VKKPTLFRVFVLFIHYSKALRIADKRSGGLGFVRPSLFLPAMFATSVFVSFPKRSPLVEFAWLSVFTRHLDPIGIARNVYGNSASEYFFAILALAFGNLVVSDFVAFDVHPVIVSAIRASYCFFHGSII